MANASAPGIGVVSPNANPKPSTTISASAAPAGAPGLGLGVGLEREAERALARKNIIVIAPDKAGERGSLSDVKIDHSYVKMAARLLFASEFYSHVAVRALYFADNQYDDLVDQLFKFVPFLPSEYMLEVKKRKKDGKKIMRERQSTPAARPQDIETLRQAIFAYELMGTLLRSQLSMSQPVVHMYQKNLLAFLDDYVMHWNEMLRKVPRESDEARRFNDLEMASAERKLGFVLQAREDNRTNRFDYSITFMPWIVRAVRIATQETAVRLVYEQHLNNEHTAKQMKLLRTLWALPEDELKKATQGAGEATAEALKPLLLSFLPKVYYDYAQVKEIPGRVLPLWVVADRQAFRWLRKPMVEISDDKKTVERPFRYLVDRYNRDVQQAAADLEWADHSMDTLMNDIGNEAGIAFSVQQFFGNIRRFRDSFHDNLVRMSQEPLGMWLTATFVYAHLLFEQAYFSDLPEVVEEIQSFLETAPKSVFTKNHVLNLLLVQIRINTRLLDEAGAASVLEEGKSRAAVRIASSERLTREALERALKAGLDNLHNVANKPAVLQRKTRRRRKIRPPEGKDAMFKLADEFLDDEADEEYNEEDAERDLAEIREEARQRMLKKHSNTVQQVDAMQEAGREARRNPAQVEPVRESKRSALRAGATIDLTAADDELAEESSKPPGPEKTARQRAAERQEAMAAESARAQEIIDANKRRVADAEAELAAGAARQPPQTEEPERDLGSESPVSADDAERTESDSEAAGEGDDTAPSPEKPAPKQEEPKGTGKRLSPKQWHMKHFRDLYDGTPAERERIVRIMKLARIEESRLSKFMNVNSARGGVWFNLYDIVMDKKRTDLDKDRAELLAEYRQYERSLISLVVPSKKPAAKPAAKPVAKPVAKPAAEPAAPPKSAAPAPGISSAPSSRRGSLKASPRRHVTPERERDITEPRPPQQASTVAGADTSFPLSPSTPRTVIKRAVASAAEEAEEDERGGFRNLGSNSNASAQPAQSQPAQSQPAQSQPSTTARATSVAGLRTWLADRTARLRGQSNSNASAQPEGVRQRILNWEAGAPGSAAGPAAGPGLASVLASVRAAGAPGSGIDIAPAVPAVLATPEPSTPLAPARVQRAASPAVPATPIATLAPVEPLFIPESPPEAIAAAAPMTDTQRAIQADRLEHERRIREEVEAARAPDGSFRTSSVPAPAKK